MEAATKKTAYAIGLLGLLAIFITLELLWYREHATLHPLEPVAKIAFAGAAAWFWWRDRARQAGDSADAWFLLFLVALTYR